ncbi:MAG: alpha-galactosidase, partial [Oscillospiraceae bacterium]|nr:alpha-galactosidase [Oscillospiraceae bacterium]
MGIFYNEKEKSFRLDAKNTSYMLKVIDDGYLAHVYYGKKVPDEDLGYLLRMDEIPTPMVKNRERGTFMDATPFEYSCFGLGDYRESCLKITDKDGMTTVDLRYVSHKIYKGKPKLKGLPATFTNNDDEADTLEVLMRDRHNGLEATLIYTAFADLDVITRSITLKNNGEFPINITRVLSTCVDFDHDKFDMITLNGSWARERHIERAPLHHGKQLIDSIKGESSHQNNPFVALVSNNADEDMGEAYGFNFVYSGNFFAQAEVTQHKKTRFVMGINPLDFGWPLGVGEEFVAPEAVMV